MKIKHKVSPACEKIFKEERAEEERKKISDE